MYIVHTPEPEETVVDRDDCQLERQRHSESMVLEIDNRGYNHLGVTDIVGNSTVSRHFLVQISAQNLSQILNVCVKVCTKQTQKGAYLQRNPFCDKRTYSKQNPFRDKSAYLSNYSLYM